MKKKNHFADTMQLMDGFVFLKKSQNMNTYPLMRKLEHSRLLKTFS